MQKSIFFDIDGTLYNHNPNKNGISEKTIQTLNKLRANGHKIYIATGRSYISAQATTKHFNFDGFVVSDGAEAIYNDESVFEILLEDSIVSSIVTESRKRGYFTMLFSHNDAFLDDFDQSHIDEFIAKQKEMGMDMKHTIGLEGAKGKTQKINIILSDKNLDDDLSYITDHYCIVTYEDGLFLDIHKKEISKAFGIERLAKVAGFSLNDVIVIGDGDNDIEMFKLANIAIAMGNASDKAKTVATFVTDDINDDGLTTAFKKLDLI